MPVGDMTTLANVKAWRTPAIAASADDAQIRREITAASRAILQQINRKSLVPTDYVETRNGMGTSGMMVRNYPIISMSAVTVEGQSIPSGASSGSASGFVFEPDTGMVYLRGFTFVYGKMNVTFTYRAGFLQEGERATVGASPYRVECSSLMEAWSSDDGVSLADGTALVAVASAPAAGQYVAPTSPDGFYLFNSAQSGAFVDISYGYTPKDLEQCCIELVCLEYNRRSRIGTNSESLQGQTVSSYTSQGFPSHIASKLSPYESVVPNP